MLKISQAGQPGRNFTLKLEGRLVGPWVNELQTICEPLLDNRRLVDLDLADVSFVDADGLKILTNLRTRGVNLLNSSPFVNEQLKNEIEN